ncbi:unnamed protein product [Strongylus vulgaris]|uniref:Peptidase A1 domain-containing protein n=1 Tax=Strongylus vulgaris TaxID=40348 RepID=A0A3P7K1M5_STRVU|nr:unnamed protein product [Strongylus vulgaris]
MKIGLAYQIADIYANYPIDGVVGLAFSNLSQYDIVSPFELAWNLGLVAPVFTVYMKGGTQEDNVDGGVVTYGGIDQEHCSEEIIYKQLIGTYYWKFEVRYYEDLVSLHSS